MNPRFPVYIISKGRSDSRLTVRYLEEVRVPYRIVVEEQEFSDYAAVIDRANILVLDPAYQRDYDTFWTFPDGTGKGSGPARNPSSGITRLPRALAQIGSPKRGKSRHHVS
jgi:hypothetical protein